MRLEGLQKPINVAIWLLITWGTVTGCMVAIASLHWEFAHDTPILHYEGLLIAKFGRIPYRDIVDTTMPGTYAFHALIIWLFGPGDDALRAVNLGFLVLVLLTAWLFLAQIDRIAATAFVAWYPLSYLGGGPTTMLQRDFLTILPIAASMALLARRRPSQLVLRALLCGLLFSAAALIKPQLALGAPLVILADVLIEDRELRARSCALAIGSSLIGFVLPITATLVWLGSKGALAPFIEFMTRYLPLYLQQNGEHVFLPPDERLSYVFWNTINFGWYWRSLLHAIPAVAIALWMVRGDKTKTVLITLAASMTVLYGLIPAKPSAGG